MAAITTSSLAFAALKGAFSFVGKKVAEEGYKKLTKQNISNEEYALRTALTTLGDERRQPVVRQALLEWLATPEWRTGKVKKQMEDAGGVTAALLSSFEQRPHGLEQDDHPRVVAETFLTAFWILHLKEKGTQVLLEETQAATAVLHDVHRDVQNMQQNMQTQFDHLKAMLHASVQRPEESMTQVHLANTPLPPDDPHTERLRRIDYSLEDFALDAAHRRLMKLQPEVEQMSLLAHAKYLRLWGNLENNRGRRAEAAQYYEEAFDYDNTSPGGQTLRGYAALLRGDAQKALKYLDRALEQQRRSDALALKVYALEELGRFADIEALRHEEKPAGDFEFALALAQTAMDQGHYEVAQNDLQPLLATEDAQDARVRLALARIKIKPVDLELQREPRVMTEIPALLAQHPGVIEALDLVNAVLADPGGVTPPLLDQAINLKQAILFWQNRFSELLEVTEATLKADPDDVLSLRHTVLAQMALNRPQDAWETFLRIPEPARDLEVRTLGASAAEQSGRFQDTADLAADLLHEQLSPGARENAFLLYTRAMVALGRPQEAHEMLSREVDDLPLLWLARAEVAQALGNHAEMAEAFRQAILLANGERVVGISLQYAAHLRDHDQLGEAVEIVRPVIDQTQKLSALAWMGYLCLRAEALTEAQRVVDALESLHPNTYETVDLAAALAAALKEWMRAAELEGRLLDLRPHDPRVLWNAAVVRHELQQSEEALALIRRFAERPECTGEELMRAADLASHVAPSQEALNWAYRARRSNHDDPAMHIRYLEIATRCPHAHNLPEVQAESAVLLVNEDSQRWIVLTADQVPSRERAEFALDSREARLLLGKTHGDKVKLHESEGGTYEIQAIITKFANAERFLLQDFHQMFPADNSIVMMRVLDPSADAEKGLPDEWQKLIQTAQKTNRRRSEASEVIARQRYPHVMNATLALESATTFWLNTFRRPGTSLNFLADQADAEQAAAALEAQAWVVDVSVLLSLALTDQLDLLLLPGIPLSVTAQTVTHLEALTTHEGPVRKALAFVQAQTTVIDASSASGKLSSLLPEESAGALAISAAQGLPLVTEDSGLRHSNRTGAYGLEISSFGVVDFLLALRRAGKLEQTVLEAHLLPLLLAGRLFLPLTNSLMDQAVTHDAGQVGSGIQAILRMVKHPNMSVQYQAVISGELLKLLWSQPDLSGRRQAVVRLLVSQIGHFEDRINRFKELYRAVQSLFHLMPRQVEEVKMELQKAQAEWSMI